MVKYFLVVCQCPSYGLAALGGVTLMGLVTVHLDRAELDSGLGMVLIVQMFLASSGFLTTARRGHFDPILIQGSDRTAVLLGQWCASVAPGALAWAALAGYAYTLGSPAAWSALAGGRLAAFAIVSIVSWTMGFGLPRGAGGALWMGVLLVLLVRHPDLTPPSAEPRSLLVMARTSAALVLCPFLMLGGHAQIPAAAVAAASAVSGGLLLAAIRMGRRVDVFLVERS